MMGYKEDGVVSLDCLVYTEKRKHNYIYYIMDGTMRIPYLCSTEPIYPRNSTNCNNPNTHYRAGTITIGSLLGASIASTSWIASIEYHHHRVPASSESKPIIE